MTDEQFDKLIGKLDEINQSILLITANDAGKGRYSLSDVCSELTTLQGEIDDVETAVGNVKTAIDNIDLG